MLSMLYLIGYICFVQRLSRQRYCFQFRIFQTFLVLNCYKLFQGIFYDFRSSLYIHLLNCYDFLVFYLLLLFSQRFFEIWWSVYSDVFLKILSIFLHCWEIFVSCMCFYKFLDISIPGYLILNILSNTILYKTLRIVFII